MFSAQALLGEGCYCALKRFGDDFFSRRVRILDIALTTIRSHSHRSIILVGLKPSSGNECHRPDEWFYCVRILMSR